MSLSDRMPKLPHFYRWVVEEREDYWLGGEAKCDYCLKLERWRWLVWECLVYSYIDEADTLEETEDAIAAEATEQWNRYNRETPLVGVYR